MDAPQPPDAPFSREEFETEPTVAPAAASSPLFETHVAPHRNPIFFGRFGLRAGYGIAIWLVCYAILTIGSGVAALASVGKVHEFLADRAFAKAHPHAPHPALNIPFYPRVVIIQDAIIFLGLLAACWLFSRAERRPLRSYGVGSYRVRDIFAGAFWGVAAMSLVVFVLHAGHWLVFEGLLLHGAAAFGYGLLWLFAFLCVGCAEEYTFRGYLQYSLMRGVWGLAEAISPTKARTLAFWIAAVILSILFALAHTGNAGENPFGLLQVFFAGITFVYALWRTGSLWWAIGYHMAWDWSQSYLFGVADSGNVSIGRLFATHPAGRTLFSGGTAGPEGSIFATIALLLTILIIHFTTRPGVQPALYPEPSEHEPQFHSEIA